MINLSTNAVTVTHRPLRSTISRPPICPVPSSAPLVFNEFCLSVTLSLTGVHGFDSEMSLVREFMNRLEKDDGLFNWSSAEILRNRFSNGRPYGNYFLWRNGTCGILAAVVFEDLPKSLCTKSVESCAHDFTIKYKLRFPSTLRTSPRVPGLRVGRWNTDIVFPVVESSGPRSVSDRGGSPGKFFAISFCDFYAHSTCSICCHIFIKCQSTPPHNFSNTIVKFCYRTTS